MGKNCCVPGCKSGYTSEAAASSAAAQPALKISFFCFPKDEGKKAQWLRSIPRKN